MSKREAFCNIDLIRAHAPQAPRPNFPHRVLSDGMKQRVSSLKGFLDLRTIPMIASTKQFSNISITLGNFPIIIVTCLFLTVADAVRVFAARLQLPNADRFW